MTALPRAEPGDLLSALNGRFARSSWFWPGVVLTSTLYLAMTFGPELLIPRLYANDMNVNLAWLWRAIDPGAFPGDLRIDYQTTFWGWPGMRAVYFLPLKFLSLMSTGKLIGVAMAIALIAIAYRIGVRLGGGRAGGAISTLALFAMFRPTEFNLWSSLHGGLPRAFASPFLWLSILGAVEANFWLLGAAFVLPLFFYPPAALVIAGAACLYWMQLVRTDRAAARSVIAPLAGCALISLVAMIWLAQPQLATTQWGPTPTWSEAAAMPIFRPGGTLGAAVVADTPFASWAKNRAGVSWVLAFALLFLVPCTVALRKSSPANSRALSYALALLVSALIGYAAAYALFFRLYLPDRYIVNGAAPCVWLLATSCAIALVRRIDAQSSRVRTATFASIGITCLLCLFCALNLRRIYPRDQGAGHTGIYRARLPDLIARRIEALPKSAIIAAPLELAGDIPFLTGRDVFVATDDLMPFHLIYFRTMLSRMQREQRALFASDFREVEAFARAEKVDFALVEARTFDGTASVPEWSDEYPELRVPRPPAGGAFALAAPPPERVMAQADGFTLVDLRPR